MQALAKRVVRKKAEAGGDLELRNSIYLSDDDPLKRIEIERGLKEAQPFIQVRVLECGIMGCVGFDDLQVDPLVKSPTFTHTGRPSTIPRGGESLR